MKTSKSVTQKRILILLAFSLCVNVGFLISLLFHPNPSVKERYHHPWTNSLLLKDAGLPQERYEKALVLLDETSKARRAIRLQKLENKIRILSELQKDPMVPLSTIQKYIDEDRPFEQRIDEMNHRVITQLRELLTKEELSRFFGNASEAMTDIRDRMHKQLNN